MIYKIYKNDEGVFYFHIFIRISFYSIARVHFFKYEIITYKLGSFEINLFFFAYHVFKGLFVLFVITILKVAWCRFLTRF